MGNASPGSLLEQARQALAAGTTNEAISLGRRLLHQAPQMIAAYVLLGDAFLQAKQPHRALAAFEHTLRLDPNNSDAYYGCGRAHAAMDHPEAAIQSFRQSLTLLPNREDVLQHLRQLQTPSSALSMADQPANRLADVPDPEQPSIQTPVVWPEQHRGAANDTSAQLFFAGIDWVAASDIRPGGISTSLDSQLGCELGDFVPGDLVPFSLDEDVLTAADSSSPEDTLLPFSLDDLAMVANESQIVPQVAEGSALANLPAAVASSSGFTWEPPTWLSQATRTPVEQDEHSIFAKLVQARPAEPDASGDQADHEYFSLDDIDLRTALSDPKPLPAVGEFAVTPFSLADLELSLADFGFIDAQPLHIADEEIAPLEDVAPFSLADLGLNEEEPGYIAELSTSSVPVVSGQSDLPSREEAVVEPPPTTNLPLALIPFVTEHEAPPVSEASPTPVSDSKHPDITKDEAVQAVKQNAVIQALDSSPLGLARGHMQQGNVDAALILYAGLFGEKDAIAQVIADLETLLPAQSGTTTQRLYRLLGSAYLKQHRYGAALRAYWKSWFGS